jgi:hypothetical protein
MSLSSLEEETAMPLKRTKALSSVIFFRIYVIDGDGAFLLGSYSDLAL